MLNRCIDRFFFLFSLKLSEITIGKLQNNNKFIDYSSIIVISFSDMTIQF